MEYYGNNDWRDYLALKHYGVKGMKWGKRKKRPLSRKKRIDQDGTGVNIRDGVKTPGNPNRKTLPVVDLETNTIVERPVKKKSSGRPLARKKRIDTDGKGVSLTGQYYREHLSGKDRVNQILKNMKKKKKAYKGKLTKKTFGSSK